MPSMSSSTAEVRIVASGLEFPETAANLDSEFRPGKLLYGAPYYAPFDFGGPDHRTAFITRSGTGHLIAVDRPRSGGRPTFSAAGAT